MIENIWLIIVWVISLTIIHIITKRKINNLIRSHRKDLYHRRTALLHNIYRYYEEMDDKQKHSHQCQHQKDSDEIIKIEHDIEAIDRLMINIDCKFY